MRRRPALSRALTAALLSALLIAAATGCRRGERLPAPSSDEYAKTVRAFYVGLAALQAGEDGRAEERLTQATQLAPGEPAAWANLGLLALRQRDFDAAAERLAKARELAPENSSIIALQAVLASNRGQIDEAIAHLRRAIELDPNNFRAVYALAEELERRGGQESDAEVERLMESILKAQPDNLPALLEVTRLAAKRGDAVALKQNIDRISALAYGWPAEAKEQLDALQKAAAGADPRLAAQRVAFLRNVLVRLAEYRRDLAAVKLPQGEIGEPFTRFLKLPSPDSNVAAADAAMTFEAAPIQAGSAGEWAWAGALYFDGESKPAAVVASGSDVLPTGGILPEADARLTFPGGASAAAPTADSVLGVDFNYDFKIDLVLAGAGGMRLYRRDSPNKFTDVTNGAALSEAIKSASYNGAWESDVEMDGDLDIVLGATQGPAVVLRNNGDGTFQELRPFEGASGVRAFIWADIDDDGDPDAAMVDAAGSLHFFTNERGGQFRPRQLPQDLGAVAAIEAADINSDGSIDLVALRTDGSIARISDENEAASWSVAQIASAEGNAAGLVIADLDNNGALDIVASNAQSARVFLGGAKGSFQPLDAAISARVFSAADMDDDGRIDLLGISPDGRAVQIAARGTKGYHWQKVRPRASAATGDQRINSFGIGGEMEVRADLLFQKQIITRPVVHFGLGERTQTDVVRIVWPNGSVQAEFELQTDQAVLTEQRLKGSCPSLFAFDGSRMRFVKDCAPWSPALGLRINTLQTASIEQTEEWVKIRGDELAPREGFYDLRITAELWESYYIDAYSMMVVDHPAGTEIFVDERTSSFSPPKLKVYATMMPRPVARAWDDNNQDVTEVVRSLDRRYLDTFGRGPYQGVTRDHYIELELGEDAPRRGPLYLIAHGWLRPTDASINVAISQNAKTEQARGLSLEVADGRGGWTVANSAIGFPAGKNKTILIDLENVFRAGAPRRLRLRTNLEIYWDAIEWAVGVSDASIKATRLALASAELRYRGFSAMTRADESSPELPDYDRVADTSQRWRDLVGYYTRFGDILELISRVDERIVIANAGDEMALRFAALPAPADGWKRDYIFIGNGWIKDGDLNSVYSKTVLPLPALDMRDYTTPPGRLEDDPVYRRHWQDWQQYHTRFVTPDRFRNKLRPSRWE